MTKRFEVWEQEPTNKTTKSEVNGMIEKRFTRKLCNIIDNLTGEWYDMGYDDHRECLCNLLNELYDEKEDWKANCLSNVNENSMLWNEIAIMREQGTKPSDAFEKYLDKISTEHSRFWKRKLDKAIEDGVLND